MKKIVLSLALVVAASAVAQAQFRPEGGEKNLEVNFAPLGGTPVTIPGIKFRSFTANNTALRLGIFVGYQNSSTITQQEDFDDDGVQDMLELTDRSSSFTVAVQPGYEWHLTGTDRLSPYVGGFVNIGYTSNTDVSEGQSEVGPMSDPQLFTTEETQKTGVLNLGLNLVAGFDYYFAEHLYIGTEVGFGFSMDNDLTSKTEFVYTEENEAGDAYVEVTDNVDSVLGNQKGFRVGPNVIGQIRVGWLF